jgi:hypothetical protein
MHAKCGSHSTAGEFQARLWDLGFVCRRNCWDNAPAWSISQTKLITYRRYVAWEEAQYSSTLPIFDLNVGPEMIIPGHSAP